MNGTDRIAPVEDVGEDTLLVTVRDGFDRQEVIPTRHAEGVAAYENHC